MVTTMMKIIQKLLGITVIISISLLLSCGDSEDNIEQRFNEQMFAEEIILDTCNALATEFVEDKGIQQNGDVSLSFITANGGNITLKGSILTSIIIEQDLSKYEYDKTSISEKLIISILSERDGFQLTEFNLIFNGKLNVKGKNSGIYEFEEVTCKINFAPVTVFITGGIISVNEKEYIYP